MISAHFGGRSSHRTTILCWDSSSSSKSRSRWGFLGFDVHPVTKHEIAPAWEMVRLESISWNSGSCCPHPKSAPWAKYAVSNHKGCHKPKCPGPAAASIVVWNAPCVNPHFAPELTPQLYNYATPMQTLYKPHRSLRNPQDSR